MAFVLTLELGDGFTELDFGAMGAKIDFNGTNRLIKIVRPSRDGETGGEVVRDIKYVTATYTITATVIPDNATDPEDFVWTLIDELMLRHDRDTACYLTWGTKRRKVYIETVRAGTTSGRGIHYDLQIQFVQTYDTLVS